MALWAGKNLEESQRGQKKRYDQRSWVRTFQEGDQLLLLLPISEIKLVAVIKRIGYTDCEVSVAGKDPPTKVFHVNLLKRWKTSFEETGDLGPSVEHLKGVSRGSAVKRAKATG